MRKIFIKTGLRFFNGSDLDRKKIMVGIIALMSAGIVGLILILSLLINSIKSLYQDFIIHPDLMKAKTTVTYLLDKSCSELARSNNISRFWSIVAGCENKGESYAEHYL